MTNNEDVLRALLDFKRRLDGGGISRAGLFQPPYEAGERLAQRLVHSAYRRIPCDADAQSLRRMGYVGGQQLRNEGTVYVTDRRARLVGNFGKVRQEWRWDALSRVAVVRDYAGVRFVKEPGDPECDAILHVANPKFVFDDRPRAVAISLMKVEAAWIIGTGQDFDSWISALPARWV